MKINVTLAARYSSEITEALAQDNSYLLLKALTPIKFKLDPYYGDTLTAITPGSKVNLVLDEIKNSLGLKFKKEIMPNFGYGSSVQFVWKLDSKRSVRLAGSGAYIQVTGFKNFSYVKKVSKQSMLIQQSIKKALKGSSYLDLPSKVIYNLAKKIFASKYPGVKLYLFNGNSSPFTITTDPKNQTMIQADRDSVEVDAPDSEHFALVLSAGVRRDTSDDCSKNLYYSIDLSDATAEKYRGVVAEWFKHIYEHLDLLVQVPGSAKKRELTMTSDASGPVWGKIAKACGAKKVASES